MSSGAAGGSLRVSDLKYLPRIHQAKTIASRMKISLPKTELHSARFRNQNDSVLH